MTGRRAQKHQVVCDAPVSQENHQTERHALSDPVVIRNRNSEPPAEIVSIVNDHPIVAPCCRCLSSTVANVNNKALREVSGNDHAFLRDLAKVGILFDQHLQILLQMEETDLQKILFSMSFKDVSLLVKARLLVILEEERRKNHAIVLDTIRIHQLPCDSHPPVDISGVTSKFRRALQNAGIEEFIPVFVYIGILNCDDFDAFCQMTKNCRKILMQNLGIKLSPLQDFLLKRFIRMQREVVIVS